MIIAFAIGSALAADPVLSVRACCAAAGTDICPTELDFRSAEAPRGTPGAWNVRCTGETRFVSDRTLTTDIAAPGYSTLPQAVFACFDAACHLPSQLCLATGTATHCDTGAPADAAVFRSQPTQDSAAAVIGGRVVKVREAEPLPPIAITDDLPSVPPDPCRPNPEWRERSSAEVSEGNEAMLQANPTEAMARYRAAIGVDACNPFAWADLGDALIVLERPGDAVRALEIAVRLMPGHYQAWTHLGAAYEQLHRADDATTAYSRAVSIRPDHPPALEGLKRLKPY